MPTLSMPNHEIKIPNLTIFINIFSSPICRISEKTGTSRGLWRKEDILLIPLYHMQMHRNHKWVLQSLKIGKED